MATEEDVHLICAELCQKLGVALPQIVIQEPQLPFFKVPTKLMKGRLEVSPSLLNDLSRNQLKIVLAYALASDARSTLFLKWTRILIPILALLIAVPYILAFEMKNPQWVPTFWALLTVVIVLVCVVSFGWSFRVAFVADRDALKLTGDIMGVQEFIHAGGYCRKASTGEPMMPNEKWTQKRLAALRACA